MSRSGGRSSIEPDERAQAQRMRVLLYARLVSTSVSALVSLGIPELLADGPRDVRWLAARSGTHGPSVRRLLRNLAAFDVLTEQEENVFALTQLGHTLLRDAAGSARPTALLLGGEIGAAWNELEKTVRTGTSPFEQLHQRTFFAYLEENPELHKTFDESQTAGLHLETDEVLDALGLPPTGTVVDIGGGDGAFLERVLLANPGLDGVLLDLPDTALAARDKLVAAGLADRVTTTAGDFFEDVPAGDVYLLSHVLHDWADDMAGAILRSCRSAMHASSSLIVIDMLVPERGGDAMRAQQASLMDLYMLALFGDGGRERTAGEFAELVNDAGLRVKKVVRLSNQLGVIEAVVR